MRKSRFTISASMLTVFVAMDWLFCGNAAAQSAQVQGVINAPSGNTMSLQTNSGNVTVVLNDMTQV